MKFVLALSLTLFSMTAFAGWTEKVECGVHLISVDNRSVVKDLVVAEMQMTGIHNGETGQVNLYSLLLPGYTFTFAKTASGRNDEISLSTSVQGQVVAMSSTDTERTVLVSNRFMTANGDYQVRVICFSL